MLSVVIKTIPHAEQRCNGNIGNYWLENNGKELQVRVSDLGDWRYEFLVAVHEFIEYFLCKWKGIDEPTIQAFNEEWYRQEELGVKHKESEAGDDPAAPYHFQHVFATIVEKCVSHLLDVDWKEYETSIDLLHHPEKLDFGGENAKDS